MFTTMENDEVFYDPNSETQNLADTRKLIFRRVKRLFAYNFLPLEDVFNNPSIANENINAMGMYDWGMAVKYMVTVEVMLMLICQKKIYPIYKKLSHLFTKVINVLMLNIQIPFPRRLASDGN